MKRHLSIAAALGTLLAVAFTALLVATPALADNYQYTVRVFPGNRGTLSSVPVTVKVDKGGSVNLYDIATAKVTDPKYMQIGFRKSGDDELLGNGVVNGISEDMDYVVAYGVEAETVQYTVRFVEYQTGKELAASRTYYGRIGEKPVAAYEYIEGYRPRYLAITGTLREGEENVWTFEYIPLAEGETIVTTTTNTTTTYVETPAATTTVIDTGADTGTTTAGQTAGTTEGATEGTAGGAAAGTTEGQAAAGGAAQNPGEGAAPQTQEILDLDTPLAGPDSQNQKGAGIIINGEALMLTTPAIVAGGVVIAAAAAGLIFFIIKLKKGKKNDEQEETA